MYNLPMQDTMTALEFDSILAMLSSFAQTELGKKKCLEAKMLSPYDWKREKSLAEKMVEAYSLLGRMPFNSGSDMAKPIERAEKGGTLSCEEFLRFSSLIRTGNEIRSYFRKFAEDCDLKIYALNIPDLAFLKEEIDGIVGDDGQILDRASPKLKSIRISLRRLEKERESKIASLLNEHKEYLSDSVLTLRNGHYALPVANAHKNKVLGIVQDVSNSGGTTFIEPASLVEIQNKIAEKQAEEKEEIARILAELSHDLGKEGEALSEVNEAVGHLDFEQAKALLAERYDGHFADLSEDGTLYIPGLRHPLLDQKKAVPSDFYFKKGKHVVLLSGPNAGGKTVALKSLGVAVIMNQMGLPLFAKLGAMLPYFKAVYVDIGDHQSILDNLSTFSAHMENVSSILSTVGGKDLVLLDELGTGTSPLEGEAIARAVLDYLLKKHCHALVSSHFEGLKAFAMSEEGMENASLLFNEEDFSPTYILKMGLPGESFGIEVAARYGLPEVVIAKAKEYRDQGEDVSIREAIAHFAELSKETELLNQRLKKQSASLSSREETLSKKEAELAKKEAKLFEEALKEKEALLERTEQKIEEIMAALQSPEVKLHQAIEAKKRLESLQEKQEESSFQEDIQEGDYVLAPAYGFEGTVKRLRGKTAEIITQNGMSMQISKSQLVKAPSPEKKQAPTYATRIDDLGKGPSLPLECNLIGMRVDEAKQALASYLDACRVKGYKRVRIIHGFGSGALRKMVREYLTKRSDFVERFESAGEYEGAGGATVVYLK